MNIAIIHEVSYFDKPVYEYQDFAERLVSKGHHVVVIDLDINNPPKEDSTSGSKTGMAEVKVYHTPYLNIPFLKYLSATSNFKRILKEVIRKHQIDRVLLYSVGTNGRSTLHVCKQFNIPVLYRVLDAYHKLHSNLIFQQILRRQERYVFRNADFILSTNAVMKEYVAEIGSLSEMEMARVNVLLHGVDTSHFRLLPKDAQAMAEYGIEKSDLIVLYLGTTYSFARLHQVLSKLAEYSSPSRRIKLMIVGGGPEDETIKDHAKAEGISELLIHTGMRAYDELPALMSVADIAINSFALNDITKDIIPIKVLQYLSAGIPTVSTPLPDVIANFPVESSGMLFSKNDNITDFCGEVKSLLDNVPKRLSMQNMHLEFITAHFLIDKSISSLENHLTQLA